jgi:hypothetical protein
MIRPYLVELEKEYRNGDAKAALRALSYASTAYFPVPDWAAHVVSSAWGDYITWKPGAESINAAMGVEREGAQQLANRRRILLGRSAAQLVLYHHRKRGRDINKALYADVAKELIDPSKIADPIIRRGVRWALDILEQESGEALTQLSGATVGRYYEEVKQWLDSTKKDQVAEAKKSVPRHHFIFDNSKK